MVRVEIEEANDGFVVVVERDMFLGTGSSGTYVCTSIFELLDRVVEVVGKRHHPNIAHVEIMAYNEGSELERVFI